MNFNSLINIKETIIFSALTVEEIGCKSIDMMFLIPGLKELFMVLDVCVKFGSRQKSGSQDTGSEGQKRSFSTDSRKV